MTAQGGKKEYNIWIVNNKRDGVLLVPETCRVSVIHVSDQSDGEKRMAAIEARNKNGRVDLSSQESIYMYSRALDYQDGSNAVIPPNRGRDSRASPECILLEESVYMVIPGDVKADVCRCIEKNDLDRLFVSFIGSDQQCSTQCAMSKRKINGTLVIDKSEFGVLELDNPPRSPLSQIL